MTNFRKEYHVLKVSVVLVDNKNNETHTVAEFNTNSLEQNQRLADNFIKDAETKDMVVFDMIRKGHIQTENGIKF